MVVGGVLCVRLLCSGGGAVGLSSVECGEEEEGEEEEGEGSFGGCVLGFAAAEDGGAEGGVDVVVVVAVYAWDVLFDSVGAYFSDSLEYLLE